MTIILLKVDLKSSKLIGMTIGQVSTESGFAGFGDPLLRASRRAAAAHPHRWRRRYDPSILERLAVLERAKACGFSLAETRQLFYGFREGAPPSERWQTLARRKIGELDELERKIAAIKEMLQRPCACRDLAECGRRIFAKKRAAHEP
jgi:MerR family redox-sensitive transcriptional activator SoxR